MKATQWRRRVKQERDQLLEEVKAAERRLFVTQSEVESEVGAKRECAHILDRLLDEDKKSERPKKESVTIPVDFAGGRTGAV